MTIKPPITNQDIGKAAKTIGCRVAAIRAVDQVESKGSGFLSDGRMIILFEPHIFWKELKFTGIDPVPLQSKFPGLLSPIWNKDMYNIGGTSWNKLTRAMTIHKEAALKSCSWGRYQILGQNHAMVGFKSAQSLVDYLNEGEPHHLDVFVDYILKVGLDDELRALDWAGFARGYNGALYWKNSYDKKLAAAYKKLSALK